MRTVLVTGGTGYVASWALATLLERGYHVRATVRSLDREPQLRAALGAQDRLTVHEADLLADAGWAEALDGVDGVLHVASPLTGDLTPALDGTLRVLRAATAAGVRRIVMTSAAAASTPPDTTRPAVTDETLWTDPDGPQLSAYQRSKVLAERAAWDLMADSPATLTTILPGAVFGPLANPAARGATEIVERLLSGSMPGLPNIALEIVDVRDLVDLHIRALEAPEAAGERFLAVSGDVLTMSEIAATLRATLGDAAAKVPKRRIPDFAVRLAARRNEDLRTLASGLGRRHQHTPAKAKALLGWRPRPAQETIADTARSLLAVR